MTTENDSIRWFADLNNDDVALVGGKNASLGEMIGTLKSEGICVPDGFATTADAYRRYITANNLEEKIRQRLDEYRKGDKTLHKTGDSIRRMIRRGNWPDETAIAIRDAYRELC